MTRPVMNTEFWLRLGEQLLPGLVAVTLLFLLVADGRAWRLALACTAMVANGVMGRVIVRLRTQLDARSAQTLQQVRSLA
jgi:hypothetical protein